MLDMSWGEVMVIGAVALIVIGPKDLPKTLRTIGQMTAKLRRMAAEFQGQFNEAMREAELDEAKRQIQGMNESIGALNQGFNPVETIREELKGAIEIPAPGKAASGRDEAHPPAPEPAIALPVPPPVEDPAEAVAAAARKAAAEDREAQGQEKAGAAAQEPTQKATQKATQEPTQEPTEVETASEKA